MTDRYYLPTPVTRTRVTLDGPEAHHLLRVMRAGAGDRVVLFDGSGAEFEAEVVRAGRGEAELAILARAEVDRELPIEVVLGVSLPKGDRQKWLVEKAVELGVRRLVPLIVGRSVARPGEEAVARLRRAVIEASKQCGRNRLMEIAPAQDWSGWLAACARCAVRLVAHPVPGAAPAGTLLAGARASCALAAGPEGGFTEEEIAAAVQAGWRVVGLGARTLRTETAAIVLASLAAQR